MIKASLVGKLRGATGAAMMDCKKALTETNGDFDEAVTWLRKKGMSAAAKKAGRVAAQGLVAVKNSGKKAVIIELNSETDFVARNEKFQELLSKISTAAINSDFSKDIGELEVDGKTLPELVTEGIAQIGENLNLRRHSALKLEQGVIASYIHNKVTDDMGTIGVLVALESDAPAAELEQVGREIAMHVAAARPKYLNVEDIPSKELESEKEVFTAQFKASGKDEKIIEKMLIGRVQKFYQEVTLMQQIFIMDNKTKIADYLAVKSKELGAPITIKEFCRFELGEGVEKEAE